jgi:hypothetical protein
LRSGVAWLRIARRSSGASPVAGAEGKAMRELGRRAVGRHAGLLPVLLLLVGCAGGKFTGGGSMSSAASTSGKAYFGFNIDCSLDKFHGQVQYVDRASGVRLHGVPTEFIVCIGPGLCFNLDCGANPQDPEFLFLSGDYWVSGQSGEPSGRYFATVSDRGEPGPTAGDEFCIFLNGGPYDGYSNCDTLEGGNVQMHKG